MCLHKHTTIWAHWSPGNWKTSSSVIQDRLVYSLITRVTKNLSAVIHKTFFPTHSSPPWVWMSDSSGQFFSIETNLVLRLFCLMRRPSPWSCKPKKGWKIWQVFHSSIWDVIHTNSIHIPIARNGLTSPVKCQEGWITWTLVHLGWKEEADLGEHINSFIHFF